MMHGTTIIKLNAYELFKNYDLADTWFVPKVSVLIFLYTN